MKKYIVPSWKPGHWSSRYIGRGKSCPQLKENARSWSGCKLFEADGVALVCAGPRNAAACSVCSAQCTVIRTQPALTPPGQMPHSAASTCLPRANCPRVALAATSGSRTGQGGRLQAGPGCPLRGRGILRAGPGYPQAAGPHYLRQPANTRVVFNWPS